MPLLVNEIFTYSFLAECEHDIKVFLSAVQECGVTIRIMIPDSEAGEFWQFQANTTLEQLKVIADSCDDCHHISRTLLPLPAIDRIEIDIV